MATSDGAIGDNVYIERRNEQEKVILTLSPVTRINTLLLKSKMSVFSCHCSYCR